MTELSYVRQLHTKILLRSQLEAVENFPETCTLQKSWQCAILMAGKGAGSDLHKSIIVDVASRAVLWVFSFVGLSTQWRNNNEKGSTK
jgi:hypothetical protein